MKYIIILIQTCLNFCMFDWSGKNGKKSGKSQGILISCVSGNPGTESTQWCLQLGV